MFVTMGHSPTISRAPRSATAPSRSPAGRGRLASLVSAILAARRNPAARRTRRVVLLLALVWIVTVCDLLLTLLARQIGGFHEANPLAREFVHDPGALAAYKFLLAGPATIVLLVFRRRLLTEVACWLLAAVYTALALLWLAYYHPLRWFA